MIGPIKATWSGNDAWDSKPQTLRVTVYGKRKRGQKETVLTFADVQAVLVKRPDGFEWVGPKDLNVMFSVKEVIAVTRVTCSVPKEMKEVWDNLGIQSKEIKMNLPMTYENNGSWKDVTIFLPMTLCRFMV